MAARATSISARLLGDDVAPRPRRPPPNGQGAGLRQRPQHSRAARGRATSRRVLPGRGLRVGRRRAHGRLRLRPLYDTGGWDMMSTFRDCPGAELSCVDYPDRVQADLADGQSVIAGGRRLDCYNGGPVQAEDRGARSCGDDDCAAPFETVASCAGRLRHLRRQASARRPPAETSGSCHGRLPLRATATTETALRRGNATTATPTTAMSARRPARDQIAGGDGIYRQGSAASSATTATPRTADRCTTACTQTYCGDGSRRRTTDEGLRRRQLPSRRRLLLLPASTSAGNGSPRPERGEQCDDAKRHADTTAADSTLPARLLWQRRQGTSTKARSATAPTCRPAETCGPHLPPGREERPHVSVRHQPSRARHRRSPSPTPRRARALAHSCGAGSAGASIGFFWTYRVHRHV
jgi:hypothetical protein